MNRLFRSLASDQLFQSLSFIQSSKKLPWVLIGLGIVFRLAEYLHNRSLWLDESFLAVGIINTELFDLLPPLDYGQAAPVGFLILEKLVVQAFGNSEYALRLFPFLSGVISLFLFFAVAKHWIGARAVPIALGLFAISGPLIYYSAEVKQYSSDVAAALLVYGATIYVQAKELSARRVVFLGIFGAVIVWFSHPSVFILAGVAAGFTFSCLRGKDWAKLTRFSIAYAIWALGFAVCFYITLRNMSNQGVLVEFWKAKGAFMPFPPLHFWEVGWFVRTFFGIFDHPVGLYLTGIAAVSFLAGCISIFLENKERFLMLISPVLLTLLASGLRIYPFKADEDLLENSGRLLLFLVPSLLLFIGEGAEQIRDKTSRNLPIIGIIFIGLLFLHPLLFASYRLVEPRTREEMKPVMRYVRDHHQDGDVIYLYCGSQPAFRYYSESYGFSDKDYVLGACGNWEKYVKDLDKLRGNKRVWIVFSFIQPKGSGHSISHYQSVYDEQFFLYHLDSMGTRLDSFKSSGSAVYAYDLSKETSMFGR